jgi:hypothetical protein
MDSLFQTREVADEAATAALEQTRTVISKHGPRLAGSDSCLATANDLQNHFSTFCNSTHTETFSVKPRAFLGFIRLVISSYFVSLVFFWLCRLVFSFVVLFTGFLIFLFEFVLCFHFTDWLYPIAPGRNVWGVIEPTGAVELTVILSGHHDSAHIFNFYEDRAAPHLQREVRGLSCRNHIGTRE